MREICQSGSEGGEAELNRPSLPLSVLVPGARSMPAILPTTSTAGQAGNGTRARDRVGIRVHKGRVWNSVVGFFFNSLTVDHIAMLPA